MMNGLLKALFNDRVPASTEVILMTYLRMIPLRYCRGMAIQDTDRVLESRTTTPTPLGALDGAVATIGCNSN